MAWKVWGQLEAERPRWGVGGLRAGGGGGGRRKIGRPERSQWRCRQGGAGRWDEGLGRCGLEEGT